VFRPVKIITLIAGALAALVVVALIGINLYLQSADVQQRIRDATEDALGAPVTVSSTTYTPWGGLTLSGLKVQPWIQPAPNMFEAAKFSVRFELLPLVNRRFVIREVALEKPVFALRQREDGVWSTAEPAGDVAAAAVPELVPDLGLGHLPVEPSVPGAPIATRPSVGELPMVKRAVTPYVVELRKLQVRDGSLLLVDKRGRPLAVLRGIRATAQMESISSGHGDFYVERLEFAEALKPDSLQGKFSFSGEKIAVSEIVCDLADGKITATLDIDGLRSGKPVFKLSAEAANVSIPRLLIDATGEAVGASGTAAAKIEFSGSLKDTKSLRGAGAVDLANARMQPVDFIRQIGLMLRIDELQMLDLTEAGAEFSIADERVNVDRLLLRSENLMITAEGPIRFNGKMNLDARLLLSEKLQNQLRPVLSNNFTASEDAAFQQVTFTVKGLVSRPETNLVERMTGFKLGSFGGLLRGLFQVPKRETPSENE
jgi:hypothetical protein